MPPKPATSTARRAYKEIIDALVEDTRHDVSDRRVREDGVYSNAEGYSEANALVASLSPEQRRVLVGILLDQRKSAIASALALLDWWLSKDVAVTYQGEPIPFAQCEGGPHGDYLARCNGWKWLDDPDPAPDVDLTKEPERDRP